MAYHNTIKNDATGSYWSNSKSLSVSPIKTCNCLRQQSIPNYKPMRYISTEEAFSIIKSHNSYSDYLYNIAVDYDFVNDCYIITISNCTNKCSIRFQGGEHPYNTFVDWLDDVFNYFSKVEDYNDIF